MGSWWITHLSQPTVLMVEERYFVCARKQQIAQSYSIPRSVSATRPSLSFAETCAVHRYTGTPSLFTESIGIWISDSLSTGVRVCECCGVGMLHCRVYVCGRFHHKKAVVLKVLASIHRQMYNCVFNSTFMVLTHKLWYSTIASACIYYFYVTINSWLF
jgi:hypothetical protein